MIVFGVFAALVQVLEAIDLDFVSDEQLGVGTRVHQHLPDGSSKEVHEVLELLHYEQSRAVLELVGAIPHHEPVDHAATYLLALPPRTVLQLTALLKETQVFVDNVLEQT